MTEVCVYVKWRKKPQTKQFARSTGNKIRNYVLFSTKMVLDTNSFLNNFAYRSLMI